MIMNRFGSPWQTDTEPCIEDESGGNKVTVDDPESTLEQPVDGLTTETRVSV